MKIKLNEPIRFGGCCDKCGRPKISCVCIQKIYVESSNPLKDLLKKPSDTTALYKKVQFKTLNVGDKFECYGDVAINYDYPKICKCIKINHDMAEEIGGISFYIGKDAEVFVVS